MGVGDEQEEEANDDQLDDEDDDEDDDGDDDDEDDDDDDDDEDDRDAGDHPTIEDLLTGKYVRLLFLLTISWCSVLDI